MKKIYIKPVLHILLFMTLILGSCSRSEFLDVEPKGIIIPNTAKDFRFFLDNSRLYAIKHSGNQFSSDQILITPQTEDFLGGNFLTDELNLFLFKDIIYGINQADDNWEKYYTQIFETNVIIERILEVTKENEFASFIAEAKLHRAYAYFNLVNLYSKHYNTTTANTDLGVPIREGASFAEENVDLTRNSVQEVYDFVINEIQSSIDDLEDTQPLNLIFRPSKAAAFALLAKVYLYQGKYRLALDNIELSLNLYSTLRDINNEEVPKDPTLLERFWPSITNDTQVVWHKSVITDVVMNEAYINLFEPNDLRLEWFSSLDNIENNFIKGSFLVANQRNDSGTEGIYTPDMFLIRAECNARLGNLEAANADLNTLRENRFKRTASGITKHTLLTIKDQDTLLQFVKEERQREFPNTVERSFDIKRYNLFDNANITITHQYNGVSVVISPNSDKWAQPIGLLYIDLNPEIEQNPRN